MNPDMFTPTLDWGNELLTSLWIASLGDRGGGHDADPGADRRFTTWGRQFWRITGDYFKGPESVKVWIWLAVLLLSVVVGVRIDVLLLPGQRHDDQLPVVAGLGTGDDAVRTLGKDGFWYSIACSASWRPSTSHASCWICS